jgi:hypothetical protein
MGPAGTAHRLRITEAGLHAVLEEMAEQDLSDLWPDTDRHTAAYRLFLGHWDESIAMYAHKVKLIELIVRRGRGTFEITPHWDWDPADRGPNHRTRPAPSCQPCRCARAAP